MAKHERAHQRPARYGGAQAHGGASGPLVFGYDPAHQGGDRHALAKRRGRKVLSAKGPVGLSIPESANYLRGEIDRDNPVKCFIDVTGGYGAGVYDLLVEWGYGSEGATSSSR